MSINQLSVYGAVADLCRESARKTHEVRGKPPRKTIWYQWSYRQNFLPLIPFLRLIVQGNLLREYEQKFAELPEQQKLTKLCSNACFSTNIEKGQLFITLEDDDDALDDMKGSVEGIPYLEVRNHPTCEGGSVETRRSAQSSM